MTRATVANSLRAALIAQESDVIVLPFVTITHPSMADSLHFVSDQADYVRGGRTWVGLPFDIEILTDEESPPVAQIRLPNVDRIIGESILAVGVEPARVMIELLSSEDFDLSLDPRQEVGTAHVHYRAANLFLINVAVNSVEITGTLKSWDYTQEIWPKVSATRDRLPALFR